MCKFTESNLPEGYILRVTYLHKGNSSRSQRHGHTYVALASVIRKEDLEKVTSNVKNTGDDIEVTPLGEGASFCHRKDSPNRKRARAIAVGRALRDAFNSHQELALLNGQQ